MKRISFSVRVGRVRHNAITPRSNSILLRAAISFHRHGAIATLGYLSSDSGGTPEID